MFAVYDKVDLSDCMGETEKCFAKIRWSRSWNKSEEKLGYYNHDTRTFDYVNMRACDLPFNQRIHLPSPLPPGDEIALQVLRDKLLNLTKEYISTATSSELCNLEQAEREGLKSITRRVREKEVVVFQTDKSGRLSVDTPENYRQSSLVHVEQDVVVSEVEVQGIEKDISAHSEAWSRILCIGKNWNQLSRVRNNMTSKDSPLAPVYTLRKDHKAYISATEGPPVRPVCGVDSSSNEKLSWLLSTFFSKLWENDRGGSICLSTEEMIAEVERVNRSSPSTPIVIGSADVKALYPSLDIDFTIGKVCETFESSDFSLEGVNFKELGLYLAVNLTDQELASRSLASLCPTRKYPKAKRLTMTGCSNRGKDIDRFAPWLCPRRQPTAKEKRLMVVQGLWIALRKVMHNHVYVFDGVVRKQVRGGPIGLRLTGDIAQVFMLWWDKEMKKRLEGIGLAPLMYQRYVDDCLSSPTFWV